MDFISASFINISAIMTAVKIVAIVGVSIAIVAGVSVILPFTVPMTVKIVGTLVLSGVIGYFAFGGSSGSSNDKGQEIHPENIEQIINIEASEPSSIKNASASASSTAFDRTPRPSGTTSR